MWEIKMKITIKERFRRWLQLRTIKFLTKFLPEGKWWLFGGWALEAITGIPKPHKDIDVGVLESVTKIIPYKAIAKKSFVDFGPLYEKTAPIWIRDEKGQFSIFSETGEFIIAYNFHGRFIFPKYALESRRQPRNLCGIKVYTATPELLYLLASTSPCPRKRERETIALLHNIIDSQKLEKIRKCFHYRPRKPPFVAPSLTPSFFSNSSMVGWKKVKTPLSGRFFVKILNSKILSNQFQNLSIYNLQSSIYNF